MGNKFMRKMIAVFVAAAVMMTCSISVFAATPSTTVGAVGTVGTTVNSTTKITVNWTAVKNADSYIVYVNGKAYPAGNATSLVISGLKAGSRVDVYVVAKNSKSGDTKMSSTSKRWLKTSKIKAKKSGKSIKVSWKKIKGAVKYRVTVLKNGKVWKTYTIKATSKTLKKLKKGTYKITVAPIYKNNYLGGAKAKTVKIK